MQTNLAKTKEQLPEEQVCFIQQLVNSLVTLIDKESSTELLTYEEEHCSQGAKEQDKLIPHIMNWLKDRNYELEGFEKKQLERPRRLGNRFPLYKERIYSTLANSE